MRHFLAFACAFVCSLQIGLPGGARAADPDPEQLLGDALRNIEAAKTLSYTATYEKRVVDEAKLEGGQRQFLTPPVQFDPASVPMMTLRTRARVLWERLPGGTGDNELRVRLSIVGKTAPAISEPEKPDEKRDAAGKKKDPERNSRPATEDRVDGEEEVRIAFNGQILRALNPGRQTVDQYSSDDGEIPLAGVSPVLPLLEVFFLPDELSKPQRPDGTKVRYVGHKTVAGRKCHVIEVNLRSNIVLKGGAEEITQEVSYTRRLYLAETDLTPCRIENQSAPTPGVETPPPVVRVDLTEWKLNPTIQPADFELAVPKDYELKVIEVDVDSGLATGDELPEATLTDVSGNERNLEEFRGKLVLLDFWASWCPPCKLSMPGIQALHDEFKDQGLTVIGVSIDVDEEIDDAKAFLNKKEFSYLAFFDGSDFSEDIGLHTIPHVILLDPEGKVLYQHTGDNPKAAKRLRKAIEANLKK